ncbi:MAG: BON domain-containing protein [Terriglobia bacterium]
MQKPNMPGLRFRIGLVLIAGALLFAGCNALKLGQSTDDKAITTQVQARLFDDPVLKMRDIHVTSDNGTVTLSGAVNTDLEKAAVERIAGQADGVKTVVNQLIVSSAATAATPETSPPAPTAEATPPQSPSPTSAPSERARASGRRHHAASTSSDEAAADQASANEAPAPNPPAMTAQDTPPAAAPAAPAAPPAPPAPPAPVVKPPEQITIPSGTILSVRMIDNIDSARNHAGDDFAASVEAPVVVGDRVVIPRNSDARVRLVQASSAGHMSGRSDLKVELVSVTAGGQTYQLETSYHEQAGASRGTRTAETVGGGAVLGALIGALAGRGRGAAIGSAVGAGAGTAAQAGTSGQQVKIPSETKLDFTLKNPATITLNPAP